MSDHHIAALAAISGATRNQAVASQARSLLRPAGAKLDEMKRAERAAVVARPRGGAAGVDSQH
jgi:hypothetical protein